MCGIAGSLNFSLPIQQVQSLLAHRGPDEQTSWTDRGLQFIHTRLAIQELSPAGRQPMHLDGLHIIFNGEIYNHMELREKHNLSCSSHADTETLLHLFRKSGTAMLNELDGMFAMAIYDEQKQKLWLIRDRAGEKPLYYRIDKSQLVFASELRVLAKILKPSAVLSQVSTFLAVGYLPTTETPFQNISELAPGTIMEIDIPTMSSTLKTWWSIQPFYLEKKDLSFEEALAETDRLLNLSVKRRMLSSDLEVGSFLSGGIDSGLVTAMAAKHSKKLKTFTVSFEGLFDESPLAMRVAKHLHTHHHVISLSLDSLESELETIFASYAEPVMDDSIIPSYYVAKEAKKHLTVVLNGDAGDEVFGGYRRYVPFAQFDVFSGRGTSIMNAVKRSMPSPANKMNLYNYLYRLVCLFSSKGADAYFSATNDMMHKQDRIFQVKPNLAPMKDAIDKTLSLDMSSLRRMLCLDFTQLLPAILLVKMDIATMANSIEGRSPFLSKELLEFAPTLPDRYKVNNFKTKFLLRQLSTQYLPPEIATQPKRGFEVPLKQWVDTRFKNIIRDYLDSGNAFVKEIMDPVFVKSLVDNKIKTMHAEQRAKILFALLSVECWHKNYLR